MDDFLIQLERFGQRVRYIRQSKGLSQEALADLSNLDRTYIGGIERGERNPSLKNILKISVSLGIEPYILFTDEIDD